MKSRAMVRLRQRSVKVLPMRKKVISFKHVNYVSTSKQQNTQQLTTIETRQFHNAKVMAKEKLGEAAKKAMSMGKNPLKNSFNILSNLAVEVALVLLFFT